MTAGWTLVVLVAATLLRLREAAARPDAEARALRLRGTQALAAGRHDDALSALDAALERAPDDFNAHYARSQALTALARHADALAALERTLELKPTFASARVAHADALLVRDG